MWKYIHTALVIFVMALPCFGQDSGVFSNYFATEEMAKWCHSGRVERCQAAGLAVTEPTFWDYLLGKNYAKLLNVKTDIRACIPYYAKHVTNVSAVLISDGIAGLTFSNDAQFLTYCGLETNALDETPYFKSQYPSAIGGWQNVMVMLTNMLSTYQESAWSDKGIYWKGERSSNLSLTNLPMAQSAAEYLWAFGGEYSGLYPERSSYWERKFSGAPYYLIYYGADIYAITRGAGFNDTATNLWKSADVYLAGIPPSSSISTFYSQGVSITTNWSKFDSVAETNASSAYVWIGGDGTTNDPGKPEWDDPTGKTETNVFYSYGFEINSTGLFSVIHWNGTKGFKYK